MGNLAIAVVFVTFVNVLMFLSQAAIIELNPIDPTLIFNCEGTILDSSLAGGDCKNLSTIDTANITGIFPETSRTISEDTGFGFVDVFTSVKNWFSEKIDYTLSIATAPYNALKSIPGLPAQFVSIIGTLWYIISVFLIIAFIMGKG